jgi:ATP-dependent helicase HrpA
MAFEKVSLYGLILIEKKSVSYSHIDATVCREVFIRSALVEGRYADHPKRKHAQKVHKLQDFFAHQQALLAELDELESKSRRRDILADEQVLFDFYDERIPKHILNFAGFEAWRKKREQENPRLLYLEREHLMRHGADDITAAQFPNELEWKGVIFPLSYHFEPGHAEDGVSIHVPVSLLHQVPEHRLEWLVPGMLRDKCIGLIKALPKNLRKHFVPVPDIVDKVLMVVSPENKPLTQVLAFQLKRQTSIDIPDDAWQYESLDDFYRMNYKIMDDRGKCLASGRNLTDLRDRYRARVQENIQSAATNIERDDITSWDFERFDTVIHLVRGGIKIRAYPALVDKGNRVALQVLDHPLRAESLSRRGMSRLLYMESQTKVKYLQKELFRGQELALSVANIGNREQVVDDLILAAWRNLCLSDGQPLPDTRAAFEQCLKVGNEKLIEHAQSLADDLSVAIKLLVDVRKQLKQQ